ncbi:IS30 family transposase [Staphylococcus massiliensis]|uniref:IS30 family transposase n=1 Tax=Staphylococcus massiliensis TaxID=555791 RepID=UPI001EDDFAFF|nr:IS30 family transposase [Staphylococcus massiliensis]MCG3402896.1 IS30 family transposase [Staphylococcus massiliensis]
MSYQHLTTFERARIETLWSAGLSMRAIARHIHRNVSTVSREIKRNATAHQYEAEKAETAYQKRRTHCGRIGKWSPELAMILSEKLASTWSPEQIIGRRFEGKLSFKTIYRWLYQGLLPETDTRCLRHKGKRQKPKETRGRFNIGTSIRKRPKGVKKRKTFGHWELDTVVSSRGKSKGCLATFVERKTRWYVALKMKDRSAASMEQAVSALHRQLPAGAFRTATVDRGKEFACYQTLEQTLGISVYFADPYTSWQRGSNENANGLLREFFPKRTDLALISGEAVRQALFLINQRPRKCLGWKTTHEAFQEELLHLN